MKIFLLVIVVFALWKLSLFISKSQSATPVAQEIPIDERPIRTKTIGCGETVIPYNPNLSMEENLERVQNLERERLEKINLRT